MTNSYFQKQVFVVGKLNIMLFLWLYLGGTSKIHAYFEKIFLKRRYA